MSDDISRLCLWRSRKQWAAGRVHQMQSGHCRVQLSSPFFPSPPSPLPFPPLSPLSTPLPSLSTPAIPFPLFTSPLVSLKCEGGRRQVPPLLLACPFTPSGMFYKTESRNFFFQSGGLVLFQKKLSSFKGWGISQDIGHRICLYRTRL